MATDWHLLVCPANGEWRAEIEKARPEERRGEDEGLATWLFGVHPQLDLNRKHMRLWGSMVRQQQVAQGRANRAEEARQEEAETDRTWAAFLEWMHAEAGPWWERIIQGNPDLAPRTTQE
jgi:hypothetical protein